MTYSKTTMFLVAAGLIAAVPAAAAENGTTLAGPAQGSKMNGSSSMTPAGSGSEMKSGAASSTGAATGTGETKSTATGGNAGGPSDKN